MSDVHVLVVPNRTGECPKGGTVTYIDDDYGSLAQGGSYEVWDCTACGRLYLPIAD